MAMTARCRARDRGPARRFVRDYVDSRRNVIGLFVPVAVPVILLGFVFPHVKVVLRITTFAAVRLRPRRGDRLDR